MRRLSALKTLDDNYLLDIYPKLRGDQVGSARGHLYLDDGDTFNHINKKEYSLVDFIYVNENLYIDVINDGYKQGQSFIIDEINIFGVNFKPTEIAIA